MRGRPFKKGKSGNPGGRPKGLAASIRGQVGEDGAELVETALAIMRSKKVGARDRLLAIAWLSDHGFGKAVTPVDLNAHLSGTVGVDAEAEAEVRLDRLSPEDQDSYLALLEKMNSADPVPGGGPATPAGTPGAA